MHDCHYSAGLIVSQSVAYKYYSDIERYPERYPRHYRILDVIEKNDDNLTLRMFLNINLSKVIDYAVVTVRYQFIPENEIRYEIIDGMAKGIVKNSLIISGEDAVGSKHYKSLVEVNHVPLDLMCYPPPYYHASYPAKYKHYIFSPEGGRENEYDRMITYFTEQDLFPLEKKKWAGF